MSVVKWWVDDSYAVHGDCRGHTGAMISLGKVAVFIFYTKQKLNGKSSIEDALICVGKTMEKYYVKYTPQRRRGIRFYN